MGLYPLLDLFWELALIGRFRGFLGKIIKEYILKVKKRTLLLIAGIVWLIAGFNVARLGILSFRLIDRTWYLYALTILIFIIFGTMFYKMSEKHTKRILAYEDKRPFWNFFDAKSYFIMVFMMSMGIGLRASGKIPEFFIGFFYTGLGFALAFAGVIFIYNYIFYQKLNNKGIL